jgi:hypothetical protein
MDSILEPKILGSLREDTPPVRCIVWKGGEDYEELTFESVYPFDTLETIKYLIYYANRNDYSFLPRFTFVGVPIGSAAYENNAPEDSIEYLPLDYLWYPQGSSDPLSTYFLKNPITTLKEPDMRFVASDGSYASPNYEIRGRSTIEKIFLKPRNGKMPVLHVFTLQTLLQEYTGQRPISEEEWNKKFAPYFPEVRLQSSGSSSSYEADQDDIEFASKIQFFVSQRDRSLDRINELLENETDFPEVKLTGIRQLAMLWSKPVRGFEGSANLFYRLPVTEDRPFMRLYPSEGSAITKLHVKGVIPIPTLEDPRILEAWAKEQTPSHGIDCCMIKYLHRPSIGVMQPIYGTIYGLNDGSVKLYLQPPKQVQKLSPSIDFRNFNSRIQRVFNGMPQAFDQFTLHEIAVTFSIKLKSMQSKKFNKTRLLQRIPFFQTIFKQIPPLPNNPSLLSLRYKAVSQYASEDKLFMFITQLATGLALEGETPTMSILNALQNEFQLSKKEATKAFADWYQKRGVFTVHVPEEGEFIESFNPGIDLHLYAQHPTYFVQVNRIDSMETYSRIYSLLSLLFLEEDAYFENKEMDDVYEEVEEEIEQISLKREEHPDQKEEEIDINALGVMMNNNDNLNVKALGIMEDEEDEPSASNQSVKHAIQPTEVVQAALSRSLDHPESKIDQGQVLPETAEDPLQAPKRKGIIIKRKNKGTEPPKTNVPLVSAKKGPLNDEEQKLVNPKGWFITKLQQLDQRLFGYTPATKGEKPYSTKCQSIDDRQPSVMTKEQYERMRAVYENDRIFWIVYPLEGENEPVPPLGSEETIYVLRYGSDGDNINYYFCPEYYCLSDEIMIREADFVSTVDRTGRPKPANTCPFCKGKLIILKDTPMDGHTVIRRQKGKSSSYHHQFIQIMKKTSHPDQLYLPCCFLRQKTHRISEPYFTHIKDALEVKQMEELVNEEADDVEEVDETDYKDLIVDSQRAVEYLFLLETAHKEYILDSTAHLTPGKFAAIPLSFDTFFHQNSLTDMITRISVKLKLRSNANGFLRIGTESTIYESLLGVIAPILIKNTISEVKEIIENMVRPRIFMNSHFGNLVLEFFNPADASAMPSTRQELMSFSQLELGTTLTSANTYAVIRIYNAFKRFIRFIRDPTQRKDLRHLQPLLAEPGLFTARGIQLIVMEDNKEDPVTIKCPIYGLSTDRHKKNDMVFISRTMRTIGATQSKYAHYELYLYTINKPAKGGERETHENIIRWDYASRRYWPVIVTTRIDEYLTQCQSRHRSLYTSQQGVQSMAIIPLSYGIRMSTLTPEGIIKDSYNHIVGITFRPIVGSSNVVSIPVVDDGAVSILSSVIVKNIYLDWEDVKPSSVNEIVSFYKRIESVFQLYPGYTIQRAIRQRMDRRIVAVQLANGLYIPASPPNISSMTEEEALQSLQLDVAVVDEMEWDINRDFSGVKSSREEKPWSNTIQPITMDDKCGSDPELIRDASYKEVEEGYQTFRLMVSNWITSLQAGSEVRKSVEDIIYNHKLPEYERRKRLYILLSSTFLSWFYPDPEDWEQANTSLLRKDCRMINSPESCDGSCYWKKDENRCLLHVHSTTQLSERKGEREVSTVELFIKRMIDDFVRFPNRRKQLMKKGEISKIKPITSAIRDGSQYIIPESSLTWSDMLRFEWMRQTPEEPKFYEEMSREATKEDFSTFRSELPQILQEIIGESNLFWNAPPSTSTKNVLSISKILQVPLETLELTRESTTFTTDSLIKYVENTMKPIGWIDPEEKEPIQFFRPSSGFVSDCIILAKVNDRIGIVMAEEGQFALPLSSFPSSLQQRWKETNPLLIQKKVPLIPEEEIVRPPLLIGESQITSKLTQIPLVVQASKEPRIVKRVGKPVAPLVPVKEPRKGVRAVRIKKPEEPKVDVEEPKSEAPPVEAIVPRKGVRAVRVKKSEEPPVAQEAPVVQEVPVAQEPRKGVRAVRRSTATSSSTSAQQTAPQAAEPSSST